MEINNALRQLNQITINNQAYPITKLLGGDMKMLQILYGINASNSTQPCVWCEFDVTVDSLNYQMNYPISRTVDDPYFNGFINEPIINYIDIKSCVPDTLHLFLRISECLFKGLLSIINILDNNSTSDIDNRIYLKRLNIFFKSTVKISEPFYVEKGTYKLRSLRSDQLEKIYSLIYQSTVVNQSFVTVSNLITVLGVDLTKIDTELAYRIKAYNFLILEFYELYKLTKNDYSEALIEESKKRLNKWCIVFAQSGSFNSNKFTPYIHLFVHHFVEMWSLHQNINDFNCQGLERYNGLVKNMFLNNTNRHNESYLNQIMEKRTRIEWFYLECH